MDSIYTRTVFSRRFAKHLEVLDMFPVSVSIIFADFLKEIHSFIAFEKYFAVIAIKNWLNIFEKIMTCRLKNSISYKIMSHVWFRYIRSRISEFCPKNMDLLDLHIY